MRTCIRCVISGRVQGVYFRASTQREAARLGVAGWVRNRPDGRVEVLACGLAEAVEKLRQWLHHGPQFAVVTEVDCSPAEDEGYATFKIC